MMFALICFTFSCVEPDKIRALEPIIVDNREECRIHIDGELADYSERNCDAVLEQLKLRG